MWHWWAFQPNVGYFGGDRQQFFPAGEPTKIILGTLTRDDGFSAWKVCPLKELTSQVAGSSTTSPYQPQKSLSFDWRIMENIRWRYDRLFKPFQASCSQRGYLRGPMAWLTPSTWLWSGPFPCLHRGRSGFDRVSSGKRLGKTGSMWT